MKPGSFDKVAIPEVKEIIEGCIRQNKDERSVQQNCTKTTAELSLKDVLFVFSYTCICFSFSDIPSRTC